MWACASNEKEYQAIRTAMFGSVMDVVDQHLPDREKHAQVRSMLSFLAVNSTYLGPYTPGSALCLAFALASPGDATMSKVRGGIGAMSDHLLGLFEGHGGELRRHAKVSRIITSAGKVQGVDIGDDGVVTAPIVVSNLDPTATFTRLLDRDELPGSFMQRVDAIDHRAAYFQIHFALSGLPEYTGRYEILNEGTFRRNVTFFGTPEQMQRDYEGCVRGRVPESPSFNLGIPTLDEPDLAPPGKHAGSSFGFYFPIGANHAEQARSATRWRNTWSTRSPRRRRNFPDLIERQINYPAYTYELMFGCTGGDFTHGLLQPEFMGPFRPGPRGWPDNPIPVDGLYLCGAGCHGGPGVTFIPGYNCGYAVLDAAEGSRGVADLPFDEGQVDGDRERQARKEAHHEEDPGPSDSASASVADGPKRQEQHVHDRVVLGGRVRSPVGEEHLRVVHIARMGVAMGVADVEVPPETRADATPTT